MKKKEVIVIGSGGHAKVCIELLKAMGEDIACCIGTDPEQKSCHGLPVLFGDESIIELKHRGYHKAFIAIGDNSLRTRLADHVRHNGFTLINAISPLAIISSSASFGVGIAIMAGVVINACTRISDLAIINTGATIDHDCRIGMAAHIAPQSALAGSVAVGDHAFLGIGTIVIPGIKIGESAVIGAGSVVISEIPSHSTFVGVPAKPIR